MKKNHRMIIFVSLMFLCAGQVSQAMTAEQAISAKLIRMYQLDTSIYRIEVTSQPLKSTDIKLDELTLRPLTTKDPLGRFPVIVKLSQNGRELESGQARINIRKFAQVVVLNDRLRRHDELTGDRLSLKKMDVTSLIEKPISSIAAVIGLRSTRNIKRGAILTSGAVQVIPEALFGHEIMIVYLNSGCRISTKGIVMQEGSAGDYIKVKNKGSGKIVMARVIDNSAVTVD